MIVPAMTPTFAILLAWLIVLSPPQSHQSIGQAQVVREHDLERLARSIFLGQAYPSGRVYLDAFGDLGNHHGGLAEWPDRILLVPMDSGAGGPATAPFGPLDARYVRSTEWSNPPELEGMLTVDSPCASEGYEARQGADYFARGLPADPGHTPDFFGTVDWFGCQAEPNVPVYQMGSQPEHSFRVIAFRPELEIRTIDYSVSGLTRPLTMAEAEEVAVLRTRDAQCTLEPRRLDEARQVALFTTPNPGYNLRLSSHVEACTVLAEVFVLDVLKGGGIVATLRSTRWRGNP